MPPLLRALPSWASSSSDASSTHSVHPSAPLPRTATTPSGASSQLAATDWVPSSTSSDAAQPGPAVVGAARSADEDSPAVASASDPLSVMISECIVPGVGPAGAAGSPARATHATTPSGNEASIRRLRRRRGSVGWVMGSGTNRLLRLRDATMDLIGTRAGFFRSEVLCPATSLRTNVSG